MKFTRYIAVVLMLMLVVTPTLASVCATNCASGSFPLTIVAPAMTVDTMSNAAMSDMKHCHSQSADTNQSKPTVDHKQCAMGAGCHFSSVPLTISSSKLSLDDPTASTFHQFQSSAKSAELLPPIKPPA